MTEQMADRLYELVYAVVDAADQVVMLDYDQFDVHYCVLCEAESNIGDDVEHESDCPITLAEALA